MRAALRIGFRYSYYQSVNAGNAIFVFEFRIKRDAL